VLIKAVQFLGTIIMAIVVLELITIKFGIAVSEREVLTIHPVVDILKVLIVFYPN